MSQIAEGSIIAGKYQLERPLARGGMGSVWIARHLQLEMRVAIKFMDAAFARTADGWTRFSREAKAVAQIQSPNVIQVHDYGVEGDTPYIAMELLQGEDLGARLHRAGRLPISAAAPIMTQMGRALRKAHEGGIVHRDLKPANVFLVRNDDEEIVKILDFGIAKITGPGAAGDATATGVVLGSAHYMSPEQVRGSKALDHRSDLWSLGVIAFRTLTGRLPFPGDQIGDVLVGICSDPLPSASSIAPDLGPDVDAFFTRALARSPAERFQSARDLAIAFAALGTAGPGARFGGTGPSLGASGISSSSAMTPNAMTPNAMTPSAMTPSAMTPSAMSPQAPMTPNAMTPGAMSLTPGPSRAPNPSFSDSGNPHAGMPVMGPPAQQQQHMNAPAPAAPAPMAASPAWQGAVGGTLTSAAQSADVTPSLPGKASSGGVRTAIIAGAVLGTLGLLGVGLLIGIRKPAGEVSADTAHTAPAAAPVSTAAAPVKQEPRVEPAHPTETALPPEPTSKATASPAPPATSAAQAPPPPPPKVTGSVAAPAGAPVKKPVEPPKKGEGPKKNEELGF